MHRRDFAAGIPRAARQSLVVLVVGYEAERILSLAFHDGVVARNARLELLGIHAGLLGKFVERRCSNNGSQRKHVADGGAVGIYPVFARITLMVHDNPIRAFGLRKDSLGEHIACGAFVHEAAAFKIDENTIAPGGADIFHQARARRTAGVDLNIIQSNQCGPNFLAHHETVALSRFGEIRAADGFIELDVLPYARIGFLAHLDVGAEAAGSDHDCTGIHGDLAAEVLCHHTLDPAVSLDEIGHLGVRHHFDSAVGFADHLLKRANVGVARRSGRVVAALPKGTRGRTDLILKLDAEVFEPIDRIHGVFGEIMHQCGCALVVAALDRLVIELSNAVLNALTALTNRVNRVKRTFAHIGRAAHKTQFLKDENVLGTGLIGRDGCRKTGSAAAHDDHISLILGFNGRMLLNMLRERRHIAARLLQAVLDALHQRKARNRSARHGIHAHRLMIENFLAHNVERNSADADRLKILGVVDLFDAVLPDGHLHGERRIVAVDLCSISAGFEGARRGLSSFAR